MYRNASTCGVVTSADISYPYVGYFYITPALLESYSPQNLESKKKVGLETILLIVVATLGTLSTNIFLNILAGSIGFAVPLLLYKEDFRRVVREFCSAIGFASRKEK